MALVFLVLAFAQPYIPDKRSSNTSQRPQAVSVYIDNSYSMETLNKEGTLLDEAKRRSKEIASAYGPNTKFQLLTNDFEGKHQRFVSTDDFVEAVEGVKISALNRTIDQVITRQNDIYSGEASVEKTSYLISDFQKNFLSSSNIKPDSSANLRLVLLKANALANISVDSLWFTSPVHRMNDTERLVVQLKNNSDKPAENIPFKIAIDGKPKGLGSLTIEARATAKDTISFSGLTAGWKRGEVTITDYPVNFDDQFYFTFNVRKQMQVLAINEQSENSYINALYRAEPFFNFKNIPAGNINYAELTGYPLIILTGTSNISAALSSQFKAYVQNGGNLMVFPSLEENLIGLTVLTQTLGTNVPRSISSQETKVTAINLQHPMFKGVFSKVPNKMDLPVAKKIIQYSNTSRMRKQQILQTPGGGSFLSQFSIGKGKVYLSAVSLSEESSNFVRHSVFVPIMYQSAFLSLRDNRLFYTLGKDQYLEINKVTLSANQTLKLKNGNFEAIPDVRSSENGTRLFISDQIKEKGVFNLLKGDSILSAVAFNDNRLESDLSYYDKAELGQKFPQKGVEIFNPGKGSIQNAVKAINNGIQLWKLCLILALVFLAAEVLLIRLYKTRESKLKI
jgi:hypothetical protein